MVKVALVRVYETSVSLGYGDGYETFRDFSGLEFKEVDDEELNELRQAVQLFNCKAARNGYSLALLAQANEADEVASFAALKAYRDKQLREEAAAAAARAAARQKAADARAKSQLAKTAKKLGVSVEALAALQAQQSPLKSS